MTELSPFILPLELYEAEDSTNPIIVADLKLIQTTWNIQDDSIVMYVSW